MPRLILAGRLELLRNIKAFCRAVYLRSFSPEEAEDRLHNLTLLDAVALWHAGLPQSRLVR